MSQVTQIRVTPAEALEQALRMVESAVGKESKHQEHTPYEADVQDLVVDMLKGRSYSWAQALCTEFKVPEISKEEWSSQRKRRALKFHLAYLVVQRYASKHPLRITSQRLPSLPPLDPWSLRGNAVSRALAYFRYGKPMDQGLRVFPADEEEAALMVPGDFQDRRKIQVIAGTLHTSLAGVGELDHHFVEGCAALLAAYMRRNHRPELIEIERVRFHKAA